MIPAVYIHIPYCTHKCPYCDFNTYATAQIPEREYAEALLKELENRLLEARSGEAKLRSIYFGGGTPSIFSPSTLGRLIEGVLISSNTDSSEKIEITVEANPETLNTSLVRSLKDAGATRISVGVQSFDDHNLAFLGRRHKREDIEAALEAITNSGIERVSIDLMFGLPEQSLESLGRDLQKILEYDFGHVSIYGLTVEPGTPFFRDLKERRWILPNDELSLEMMQLIESRLNAGGYNRYEISNFSKLNQESVHNTGYWKRESYLGLGAGAHSFMDFAGDGFGVRWSNVNTPDEYIRRCGDWRSEAGAAGWQETLTRENAEFEFLFLGLRMTAGIEAISFERRFGERLADRYGDRIEELVKNGLVTYLEGHLSLSPSGLRVADSIFEYLAPGRGKN